MIKRSVVLDALRGLAILGMVFSSSIAFGILPAWMYHAQEPPPTHIFNPNIPGITWVDLVFPVFLFSMGAAIPLSLKKLSRYSVFVANKKAVFIAIRRYLLLFIFSIIVVYARPDTMNVSPGYCEYLITIGIFFLLHFSLFDGFTSNKKLNIGIKATSYLLMFLFLYFYPFAVKFSIYNVDAILLILANMACFGTFFWWVTKKSQQHMFFALLLLFAFFLSGNINDSWEHKIIVNNSLSFIFNFSYLKYLFIVIPGTLCGEWMLDNLNFISNEEKEDKDNRWLILFGWLSLFLVVINIILLFVRWVVADFMLSAIVIFFLIVFWKRRKEVIYKRLYELLIWGSFFCLAGIILDPFEGGIKKDPVTFSYLFLCSGISFFLVIFFYALELSSKIGRRILNVLSLAGRNPMVAYVSGGLLVSPVLYILHLMPLFYQITSGVAGGFLRGIIYTSLVMLVTVFFTKRKWYWKS